MHVCACVRACVRACMYMWLSEMVVGTYVHKDDVSGILMDRWMGGQMDITSLDMQHIKPCFVPSGCNTVPIT